MGNPDLSLVIVVVLFIVSIFSAAIPGLLEYNYVVLLSYNLASATRRKRFGGIRADNSGVGAVALTVLCWLTAL